MTGTALEVRVVRSAEAVLAEQQYVSALDVLLRLGWLAPTQVDRWRQGRADCLERLVQANLAKISKAMAHLRRWAVGRGLLPRETAYVARTRDRRPLRFSVSGRDSIERTYRTHWVSPELSAAGRDRREISDGDGATCSTGSGAGAVRQSPEQTVKGSTMRRTTLTLATAAVLVAGCGSGGGGGDTGNAPPTAPASNPVPSGAAAPQVPGLLVYESTYDVAETSERVQAGLVEAGMVTAVVDHAANAESVGEQLRPTTLVIGGAPMAGTPSMQEQQTAGIDLPQKFLSWEAGDGTVYLGYNSAEYVGARAGIAADSAALDGLRTASAMIAATAGGNDEPVATGEGDVSGEGYLVEQVSELDVADAITLYEEAFAAMDLMPVATVDHAAGAASTGEQLRPTSVTIVGNPQVGTALLQANQTMGIDLPVRYLAWEDEAGVVHVGHPDIRVLAERHDLSGVDDQLDMVETATNTFTRIATGG